MSLRAQDHENIITAARKKLYGENRWWVVDVYVEDCSECPSVPWKSIGLPSSAFLAVVAKLPLARQRC
jgi:hypothetical protein